MPLDRADKATLMRTFETFAETRDPSLRDELIEAHLGLAEYLARRFANRGEPLDDLVQVASLGLVKAVERFDAGSAYRSASLDAGRSDDEESPGLLGQLGELDPELSRAERRAALSPLLAELPEREQVMLYLRFYEGMTQSEIAKRLDISQ